MNLEWAVIPELVAYHIAGGSLADLRHAERMLADLERQTPDPVRAANLRAIRGAVEQLRQVRGLSWRSSRQSGRPDAALD
jgi:hypothetical protein